MTKIIAWIVLVFVVLLALRLINQRKARARRKNAPHAKVEPQPMVRCASCGVFMPRSDARLLGGQYLCPDNACTTPR